MTSALYHFIDAGAIPKPDLTWTKDDWEATVSEFLASLSAGIDGRAVSTPADVAVVCRGTGGRCPHPPARRTPTTRPQPAQMGGGPRRLPDRVWNPKRRRGAGGGHAAGGEVRN